MTDDWFDEPTEKRMAVPLVAPKTEPELLAAIANHEHETRIVYADWLEEQCDFERAEYVRLQDVLVAEPANEIVRERVVELSLKLDAAWRVLVARPRILNCARARCPGDWGSLAPTHTSDERICGTCHARIEYVFSLGRGRLKASSPAVLENHYDPDATDSIITAEWPAVP